MKIYPETNYREAGSSWLNMIKWIVIFVLLLGVAFLVYAMVKIYRPHTSEVESTNFVIPFGLTTKEIARNLESEGIINDAFFFELHVYLKKQGEKIQAGNYLLSSSMSIREVANALTQGQIAGNEVRLTVIEGWMLDDIANALQEADIISQGEFYEVAGRPRVGGAEDFSDEFVFLRSSPAGASLEGFLFPDTYLIDKDTEAREVVKKILQNFDEKLSEDFRHQIQNRDQTIYEIVTLASIIER